MAKAWDTSEVASPAYILPEPNGVLSLGKERVRLTLGKKPITADADVLMRLVPSPRALLRIRLSDPADGLRALADEDSLVNVRFLAWKITVECLKARFDGSELTLIPTRDPLCLGSPKTRLKAVTFHLLNFPAVFSRNITSAKVKKATLRLDHLVLSGGGWRVVLSSLPTPRDHVKLIRNSGGYGFPHAGRIVREDGGTFAGQSVNDFLTALHLYLSFARGFWSSPNLAVGYTGRGKSTWTQWGAGQCSRWRSVRSWFDGRHGSLLAEAFPGFLRRRNQELWRAPIMKAIALYLASNTPHVDTGIVLTQTALELLSWVYVVKEQKLISAAGFNDLRSSDRLRLLCSSLGMPLSIPACLKEMAKAGKPKKWLDAMHAITEIRNSIVHPQHKRSGKYNDVLYEAWNLGLWYLELLLLRLFGHDGKYGNRLVQKYVGEVEDVPWATKAAGS